MQFQFSVIIFPAVKTKTTKNGSTCWLWVNYRASDSSILYITVHNTSHTHTQDSSDLHATRACSLPISYLKINSIAFLPSFPSPTMPPTSKCQLGLLTTKCTRKFQSLYKQVQNNLPTQPQPKLTDLMSLWKCWQIHDFWFLQIMIWIFSTVNMLLGDIIWRFTCLWFTDIERIS